MPIYILTQMTFHNIYWQKFILHLEYCQACLSLLAINQLNINHFNDHMMMYVTVLENKGINHLFHLPFLYLIKYKNTHIEIGIEPRWFDCVKAKEQQLCSN